jgi:hypothetical protein
VPAYAHPAGAPSHRSQADPTLPSWLTRLRPCTSTLPDVGALVYIDTDWAGFPDTCRSTSGYVVFLDDNLVSWAAKRQPVVSRSNAEAECRALANGVERPTGCASFSRSSTAPFSTSPSSIATTSAQSTSPPIPCSISALHVEIDPHFVRERVAVDDVRVLTVPTTLQFSDIFIKELPASVFTDCRSSLNIYTG